MLQALDAYVPSTAWQRVFEAFALPSPLSDDQHSISEEAKTQVKEWLRLIYTTAGWKKSAAFLDFKRLLVSAEVHYKGCCTVQQAWARASSDFPELTLGREQVSLYLVFGGNTGTVERWLKSVAMQYTAERSKMLGCTVDDALQGELMAPAPHEVCRRIETPAGVAHVAPSGNYLPSILREYRQDKKRHRTGKAPKPRRDKNIPRDVEALNAARVEKGRPITERETLDKREVEMKRLVGSSDEKRNRMMAKAHFSKHVPAADSSFVNAATEKVRDKIAKKAKQIEQRYLPPEDRPTAELMARPQLSATPSTKRWGLDTEHAQVQRKRKNVPVDIIAWTESFPTLTKDAQPISLLHRHGWKLCTKACKFYSPLPRKEKRVFIAHRLVDGAMDKKSFAVACRFVGGTFTTLEWLRVAVRPHGRLVVPQCLAYIGVCQKSLQIAFTETWAENERLKDVVEVVKAAAASSKLKVLSTVKAAKKAFKAYIEKHGKKSKPWNQIYILAVSDADAEKVTCTLKRKYQPMVIACEDFLSKKSKLQKHPVVSGQWATED